MAETDVDLAARFERLLDVMERRELVRVVEKEIWRIEEFSAMSGLSVRQIHRLCSDPNSDIPRPVRLSENAKGWRSVEVREWLEKRPPWKGKVR